MYIIFVILGFLMTLVGVLLAFMFPGSEAFALSLVGAACFVGILARMDQASSQTKKIIKAVEESAEMVMRAPTP